MKSTHLIKPYFTENRLVIVIGINSLIIVDFLQLFIPRVVKWAVDDLTGFQADMAKLLHYALYIVGIAIMIGIFRYIWRRCLIGMSRRVEEGLRNKFFEHIQKLSASYFHKIKTGDLMAHATNDIQHIRMATGMGMVALTDAVVLGAASIGFMAYINIRLTLFVLIPMPLIVFSTRFFSKKMHRRYQEVQGSFADLTEIVRERFSGIRVIKAYNREKEAVLKLEEISKNYIHKNIKLAKITQTFFPMMLLFSNLSLGIVICLGGRQTINATITSGDFVAFISYIGLLTWPMMAMGWVVNLIQRGKASLDRINKILETLPEIDNLPDSKPIKRVRGEIVFENVTFSYEPRSYESGSYETGSYESDYKSGILPALSDINIKLEPGKTLGIVGPPGSGKTTLLSLIPRLFEVSQGCIRLDYTDIRKIHLHDLRSLVSFMPQEPFLFGGTIRGNITLNHKKTKESELIRASKESSLYETIKSFPNGFETIVGEKGVVLSGGQKQRIALARSLLKDAPILILDDPISQVDLKTGAAIIKTIRSMAGSMAGSLNGKKTIIIVSHRLSAVRFADQIITLTNGRIMESGTHTKLMENDQYYANTFRLQKIEEEFNAF